MEALADYFGCTSMNTESQQQIAQEAAEKIQECCSSRCETVTEKTRIILSAIERATPKAFQDGVDSMRSGIATGEGTEQQAAQPQLSEQQEWTKWQDSLLSIRLPDDSRIECSNTEARDKVITAHNTALAAERQRREQLENKLNANSQNFQIECQKAEIKLIREKLLSALTAIEDNWKNALLAIEVLNSGWWGVDGSKERTNAIRCRNILRRIAPHEWESGKDIPPDLSLLHEHDKELRAKWDKEHESSK